MATIPRYKQSIDPIRLYLNTLSRNNYKYCYKCHSQLQRCSFSSSQSWYSESDSFTEKLRRRIFDTEKMRRRLWKTDKPSGRIDPYSPTSPLRKDVEENLESIEEGYRNSKEAGKKDEEDILSQSRSSTGGGNDNVRAMRKQMPTENSVYVPAETIDGLEWLGSPRWKVKRRKVYKEKLKTLPEWGRPLPEAESQKFTWTKPEENSSPEALLKALHRALVEVFTFLSAGQDPLNVVTSQGKPSADWTVAVRIDPSEDRSHAVLTFANAEVRDRILGAKNLESDEATQVHDAAAAAPVKVAEDVLEESGGAEATAASEEALASSEAVEPKTEILNEDEMSVSNDTEGSVNAENQITDQAPATPPQILHQQQQQQPVIDQVPWGKDWKSISIKDPLIKFALIKRLIQITGLRIADHHIRQCDTANDLYHSMKDTFAKDKKPKLAALLLQEKKTELAALPNVMVSEKRVSRLDRDIRTGRHVIIARELKKRGLLDLDSRSRERERGRGREREVKK